MDKEQIESFLSAAYPGHRKFMDGFITPLFDRKGITDYQGVSYQLDTELKGLAGRSGIQGIKLCADVNADYSTLKVFDVTVRDNVMLRRNRVTVQQLVRRLAKGGNALMVFHHAGGEEEWRLSFYQDFAGHETSAKRHTFLVGPGQNMRTVTTNFFALHTTLLANDGLEDQDFVACFDTESLSKEFFAKYKAHYEKFCAYVTSSEDSGAKRLFTSFGKDAKRVRDYVKKMMGRLVFLQFLQKKGWMGVPVGGKWGEGDKNFLQTLFKKATVKQRGDFLDAVLEPLFFQALNTDRTRTRDVFDTGVVAYGKNGKVRIPYLNGGLFTNDNEDNFRSVFPAAFFSNPEFQDDPDPAKCGLLDFFAQYNFTIDENDPTEAEVGVDPEMLSCIFENLLEDNKDKGAFYTPKTIVEYMCRQSLTAYLQTGETEEDKPVIADFVSTHDARATSSLPIDGEEMRGGYLSQPLQSRLLAKLKAVRICDPAIGSGAFPMGLLRELVFCRSALGDPQADNPAELKKEIIESNIYGVDIEKGAVDIARLRFWLSLVVDEDSPLPLPNLDFKIMQGNSLLESYKGLDLSYLTGRKVTLDQVPVTVTLFENEIDLDRKRLRALMGSYYECHDPDKKRRMRDEIRNLVARQVEGNWATDGRESAAGRELKEKILRVLPTRGGEQQENLYLFGNSDFFPWHLWFADVFDKGGFDIVIGNPPYVESRSPNFPEQLKVEIQRQLRCYHSDEDCAGFPRGADLMMFFYELAFRILGKDGINTFIIENSWLFTNYGKAFQDFLLKNIDVRAIVDSDYRYFENADVNTIITFFANKPADRASDYKFFHCHGDLVQHTCDIWKNQSTNLIDLKIYTSESQLLHLYKWGFLNNLGNEMLDIFQSLLEKNDSRMQSKFSIGQGLNLTKDHIQNIAQKDAVPYFTVDCGAIYSWSNSCSYIDRNVITVNRKMPQLILPRGIGTHFCCRNEIRGYSASYVELYADNASEDEILAVWLFCNSSLLWLLRECSGRCNLGGGMLKAEATDLKMLPLYYNFQDKVAIRKIYAKSRQCVIPSKIEDALSDPIHLEIDKIVFSSLDLSNVSAIIRDKLLEKIKMRSAKSKTAKKK